MERQAITTRSELECMLLDESAEPRALPLSLLKDITNDFSDDNIIGSGGFAVVYKGMLDNCMVAVKKLSERVVVDDNKFSEEIHCLMKGKHKNIVRFLGYCSVTQGEMLPYNEKLVLADTRQRLLCFEYLPKGSLDNHITDASRGLEWRERFQIINGICNGLDYLHQKRIVHLDLKPQNILLDDNMMPKITDFGLSRFLDKMISKEIISELIGTLGYFPPEFINERQVTFKSDIYSLGIIISEIITGKKGCHNIDKVLRRWKKRLEESQADTKLVQVRVCTEIAIECTNLNPATRPDIQDIIYKLGTTKSVDECATENGLDIGLKKSIEKLHNMRDNVQQVTDIRVRASDVEEAPIIGRSEEKQKIISILSGSTTKERVILPIYGIGGIGKTTMAKLVFDDTQFEGYSRVWVHISRMLDLHRIGNSIISQLSMTISEVADMQTIHIRLGEVLAGKRILIVLDDLWEVDTYKLDKLKAMLRLGLGSQVITLVTTRDETIARNIICGTVTLYKVEPLSDDMCWTIIQQRSMFSYRPNKEQLERIGMEIATKCGGVPLAAQWIGYILRDLTSDQWESVRDSYMWNLLTLKGSSSEVLASLLLTYIHMPYWLKLCFQYCAIFPKGHKISKNDLIHQWIALGLIEQSTIFTPMQLGEKYLSQLFGISFLHYSKTTLGYGWQDKDVALFMMHDQVHDLAIAILADPNTSWVDNSSQISALQNVLKALEFLSGRNLPLSTPELSPAKGLRFLDLSNCLVKKLPDSIGQLKKLRYLNAPRIEEHMIPTCITELSQLNHLKIRGYHNISALPESIGDMKGLLHLDLSSCNGIRELPMSFAELKQLVHLDFSDCSMSMSADFGGFTNLQHLNLSVEFTICANRRGLAEVIGNLFNLRYLNISGSMNTMATSEDQIHSLVGSIFTLSNLEHLDLSRNADLSSIPASIVHLGKLLTLDLSGCFDLEELPDSLAKMASLKILNVGSWVKLRESTIPWSNIVPLPHFVVHASSDKCRSNIIMLQPKNPDRLTIDRLENVKSAEEAQSIKLIEKQKIQELTFQWTVAAERSVDDKEVLERLVPPSSVQRFYIGGYKSVSIPDWYMGIWQYLPSLLEIYLWDFPRCNKLPPFGLLPNLRVLGLCHMDSLEMWSTTHYSGEEGETQIMFPKLETLTIEQCSNLRIKPCLPRAMSLHIEDSDNVLSTWEENSSHSGVSSSSPLTNLSVGGSKVPLHRWRLLHHVPALRKLTVSGCSDLTSSPEIIQQLSSLESLSLRLGPNDHSELPRWLVHLTSLQHLKICHPKLKRLNENTRKLARLQTLSLTQCRSMTSLPHWFGELASLGKFEIEECEGIRCLPDSIQQLSKLRYLNIRGCPTLMKWCELKENKMKLAHIREKEIW